MEKRQKERAKVATIVNDMLIDDIAGDAVIMACLSPLDKTQDVKDSNTAGKKSQ